MKKLMKSRNLHQLIQWKAYTSHGMTSSKKRRFSKKGFNNVFNFIIHYHVSEIVLKKKVLESPTPQTRKEKKRPPAVESVPDDQGPPRPPKRQKITLKNDRSTVEPPALNLDQSIPSPSPSTRQTFGASVLAETLDETPTETTQDTTQQFEMSE